MGFPPGDGGVVKLLVARDADGGTLVFVAVMIQGEGPFAFALDTGASHSIVDSSIAQRLGLASDGDKVDMSGVAADLDGTPVRVDQWSIEGVPLPAGWIVAAPLSSHMSDAGMQGLLGSDVLSTYNQITIHYGRQCMVLR